MVRYEILDHTADLLIRADGKDLAECCENLAYGMFDQMVALKDVRPLTARTVDVTGTDPEDALYSFLSELLYLEDGEGLVFCDFKVTIDGLHIRCTARGEPLDRSRMEIRDEIKAVTFHAMEIDRQTPRLTVLFDV
ncbi:MAG: archease [Candidatus Methanomethylophilus sp.]|nr:archease [Methanomethylophilus sp.]MDD3232709.1 archease [Methanomethylophilus sp.]MDD4221521.1 archease [Methanomethylophilus sp.]MDD4668352.1 archease [Methanomethylophilus sp.]